MTTRLTVTLSMSAEALRLIDAARGPIPRSRYVEMILLKHLEPVQFPAERESRDE